MAAAGVSEEARRRFRWRLADEGPGSQQVLFDEEGPAWRAGHGEFRGLEFLEVRAKRIINEVPASSPVPFRYTINAYRGCAHRCVYCLAGHTAILMADGRTKSLAEVRAGDAVYGTARAGADRRYVVTRVLDHWQTSKAAYRVILEDGTELIASGDHRFWTARAGWRFVTGAGPGRPRRPHLTLDDSLVGTGRFAEGPKVDLDYRRGYLCGLIRGRRDPGSRPDRLEPGDALRWPDPPGEGWAKGFLAGAFDAGAAGGDPGTVRLTGVDGEATGWIESCLRRFGFPHIPEGTGGPNGRAGIRLTGGVREHLRFFHLTDPAGTGRGSIEGRPVEPRDGTGLGVTAIEPLGMDLPLYDITTGTGDFIADGVISHNCFARPTHAYLNLNTGDDFDRKIVVKINAVQRARAEVASAKWSGDLIAMGTNTDPYQRCEGKYRLTRGIVEVLGEARNPFSILTKSTLILRDVDVLAEAARRTRVQTAFSVGTVDDEVWRLSEPGTPHPRRRLEALARLREAGITTGVLAAPILPGISDSPAQLEALARALVEAGVGSADPIVLHLRPGVREEYFSWLAEARPDLLARYEGIYHRRSYAPRQIQSEITARFQAAFAAARRRTG